MKLTHEEALLALGFEKSAGKRPTFLDPVREDDPGDRILSTDAEHNLLLQRIGGDKPEMLWRVEIKDWETFFPPQTFAVSPDERTVAAGGFIGRVTLWDLPTSRKIGSFTNPSPWPLIYGLAFSPDGQTLAAAEVCGTVRLSDTAARLQKPGARAASIQGAGPVTFSPDGKQLISGGGGDDDVMNWDLATRQELLRLQLEGGVGQLAFAPDGNRLFALNSGTLCAWRAPP